MKKNAESSATRRAEKSQNILIISIFLSVIMITGIVYYFGTAIVWVPITLLTALIVAAFYNPYVKAWTKGKNWVKLIVFLPLITGITSALSQIENAIAIASYFALPLILVIKIVSIIIKKKRKERITAEKHTELQHERTIQEANERAIKQAKAEQALENIKSSNNAKWEDILAITYIYNANKISEMEDVMLKIISAPLHELIIISDIKKHIVWTYELVSALMLIEKLTSLSYDDNILKVQIKKMKDFLTIINSKREYTGYNSLAQTIQDNCRETLYLAADK